MKVKIGDKICDAEDEPIMLILSETDKKNIGNMHFDATKYCVFPDNSDLGKIKEFMKVEDTFDTGPIVLEWKRSM